MALKLGENDFLSFQDIPKYCCMPKNKTPRLFVGGLPSCFGPFKTIPYSLLEAAIRRYFEEFGPIRSLNIKMYSGEVVAYLVFQQESSVWRVTAAPPPVFFGKHTYVTIMPADSFSQSGTMQNFNVPTEQVGSADGIDQVLLNSSSQHQHFGSDRKCDARNFENKNEPSLGASMGLKEQEMSQSFPGTQVYPAVTPALSSHRYYCKNASSHSDYQIGDQQPSINEKTVGEFSEQFSASEENMSPLMQPSLKDDIPEMSQGSCREEPGVSITRTDSLSPPDPVKALDTARNQDTRSNLDMCQLTTGYEIAIANSFTNCSRINDVAVDSSQEHASGSGSFQTTFEESWPEKCRDRQSDASYEDNSILYHEDTGVKVSSEEASDPGLNVTARHRQPSEDDLQQNESTAYTPEAGWDNSFQLHEESKISQGMKDIIDRMKTRSSQILNKVRSRVDNPRCSTPDYQQGHTCPYHWSYFPAIVYLPYQYAPTKFY